MSEGAEERPAYAVRFSTAVLWRTEITGDAQAARTWRDRLLEEVGTLTRNPRRFRSETHRLLFRPIPGSAAYHVFFLVTDETPDGPRVQILHIRHAARKPITREEARRVLANP